MTDTPGGFIFSNPAPVEPTMSLLRKSIARLAAISLIATQLLCGCIGYPSHENSFADQTTPASAEVPPCHSAKSPSSADNSETPSANDHCHHCEPDIAAAFAPDAPNPTGANFHPSHDDGPAVVHVSYAVKRNQRNVGLAALSDSEPSRPQTLVSLQVLLLS